MSEENTRDFFARIAVDIQILERASAFCDLSNNCLCRLTDDTGSDLRKKLHGRLREYIYSKYYANDIQQAIDFANGVNSKSIVDQECSRLGKALSETCSDYAMEDPGWAVVRESLSNEGTVLLEKNGVYLRARCEELVRVTESVVAVKLPPVRRYALAGWTVAFGKMPFLSQNQGYARHYFPVRTEESLTSAFSTIAHFMNKTGHPFQLKAVNNPSRLVRSDNIVLFVSNNTAISCIALLYAELKKRHGSALKQPPPLTRVMDCGWGVAAEPSPEKTERLSYGQSRCSLIAEGLMDAGEKADSVVKVKAMTSVFLEHGLTLDKPYNQGGQETL